MQPPTRRRVRQELGQYAPQCLRQIRPAQTLVEGAPGGACPSRQLGGQLGLSICQLGL